MAIVIGLTGLIGTGKSTVAGVLARMNIPVHDADKCVHSLYQQESVRRMLLRYFPMARSWKTGDLDRTKLMKALKKRPERKALLDALIHPLVLADQMAFLRIHRTSKIVVLDVPLLFEAGMDSLCDVIWVTTCRPALQKRRVMRRPGFTEEKFETIKKWQGSDTMKKRMADLVIDTGISKAHLARHLKKALNSYYA